MYTVLITSGGGSSAINCINALKKQTEISIRIIAIDSNKYAPGLFLTDRGYHVVRANCKEYIDQVLTICNNEKVQVLLPTYSDEIAIFAANVGAFSSVNTKLILSSIEEIKLFENKWSTNQFFLKNLIPTPKTWLLSDVPNSESFPLYIKPVKGSGSRNNHIVYDLGDLRYFQNKLGETFIAQKFIGGKEYTVDIIADRESNIIAAVSRERINVKGGMAIISRTIKDNSIKKFYERIIEAARLVGPINIQYFKENNQYYFTDVNTRFSAGGLPLTVASGVNIPLIAVKLALGIPVQKIKTYKENLIMIRYYTEIYKESNDGYFKYT